MAELLDEVLIRAEIAYSQTRSAGKFHFPLVLKKHGQEVVRER